MKETSGVGEKYPSRAQHTHTMSVTSYISKRKILSRTHQLVAYGVPFMLLCFHFSGLPDGVLDLFLVYIFSKLSV